MSADIKYNLKSSVFTAALYTSLCGLAVAPAAASSVMSPASGWSVNKVESAANDYCTLAREYNNNVSLRIAENATRDTSIAVEFPQNRFDAGRTYLMNVETSNGVRRNFQVSPATARAFIVRFRDDAQFYESFWKSSVLLLTIDGQTYSFNTKDIAQGQAEVQSCLGGSAPQSAAAKPQPARKTAPQITTRRVVPAASAGDPQLQAELETLRRQNADLTKSLSNARADYQRKVDELSNTQSDAVVRLTEKLSAQKSENARLEDRISSLRAPVDELNKVKETLQSQLETLRSENQNLKTSLSQTSEQAQDVSNLEEALASAREEKRVLSDKLARLEQENAEKNQLLASMQQGEDEQVAVLNKSLEKLGNEHERLKNKVASLQSAQGNMEAQSAQLARTETVVGELKTERDRLMAELSDIKQRRGQEATNVAQAEEETIQLEQRLSDMDARLDDVVAENEDLKNRLASAKQAQTTNASASEELDVLSGRLDNVIAENRRLKQQMVDREAQQLADAEVAEQNADQENEHVAALESKVENLNGRLETVTAENERLKDEMAKRQTTLASADSEEIQGLRKDLTSLRSQMQRMESENDSLSDELVEMRMVNQHLARATLDNGSEDKLNNHMSNVNAKLEQISAEKQALQDWRDNIQVLRMAQMAPSTGGDAASDDYTALQRRYQEAEREIQRMGAMLEQQRVEFEMEKDNLENMLFDPSIAEREQVAHLAELEQELELANQALEEQRRMYEERLNAVRSGEPVPETPITTKRLGTSNEPRRAADPAMMQEMGQEIERLRGEVKRLSTRDDALPMPETESEEDFTSTAAMQDSDLAVMNAGQAVPGDKELEIDESNITVEPLPENTETAQTPAAPEADIVINESNITLEEPVVAAEKEPVPEATLPQAEPDAAEDDIQVTYIEEPAENNDAQVEEQVQTAEQVIKPEDYEPAAPPAPDVSAAEQPSVASSYSVAESMAAVTDEPLPYVDMIMMLQRIDPGMRITDTSGNMLKWQAGGVQGASVKSSLSNRSFDETVDELVQSIKAQCSGEMQLEPVMLRKSSKDRLYVYDATCDMGGGQRKVLSLIFHAPDDKAVTTIAYEGTNGQRQTVTRKREGLMNNLMSG